MTPTSPLRYHFVWMAMLAFAFAASGVGVSAKPTRASVTITFTAHARALSQILDRIGDTFDVSIVARTDLRTPITVALRELSLDEALRAVLAPIGATYHREGRLVTIETSGTQGGAQRRPGSGSAGKPVAIAVTAIPVERAAAIVQRFYPQARVVADKGARTLFVDASPADADGIRSMLGTLDVPDATRATTEAVQISHANPSALAQKLQSLFPTSRISSGPNHTLLIDATESSRTQIKALVASIDAAPPAGPSSAPAASEAVHVTQIRASDAARAVASQDRAIRATAVGDNVVLSGPPEDVARAKSLVASIDVPGAQARYTSLYRLKFVDAKSVQALLQRTFPGVESTIDAELNVISVLATGSQHTRIAQAIAQIDEASTGDPVPAAGASAGPSIVTSAGGGGPAYQIEVVNLKAAMPSGAAGTASTTTTDVAATVLQTLGTVAPDLHLTAVPNQPQIIVSGSPYAVKLAKEVIARIDTPQKLVILDTQILEVNETVAKNLGLSFAPNSGLSTTYSETTPQPNSAGLSIPLLGLQPLSRTPLSLQFQLGLAISQGKGRILADPRITTLSGKTASIRAGDNLTVLTQTGGGTGVAVTTQLQTFNTGVSLDITPIVNDDNYVTINLHPVVNNVSSISSAGIPQISTRDTQTTIGIKEGQTLVIGGLIQDNSTRTTTKIPILGDLPLIGPAFRNEQVNNSRDELIITITPHIVDPLQAGSMIPLPPPAPLPTPASGLRSVLPGATFPPMPGSRTPAPSASLGPISYYGTLPQTYSLSNTPVPTTTPTPSTRPPVNGTNGAGPPSGSYGLPPGVPPNPLGALPFALPSGSGAPQATPSAFAGTNVFTYGSAPTNNYAGPNDQPQIFYVTFAPTVLRDGTNITISAVTTTNVNKVTLGYGNATTSLTSAGPGKWQASYAFSAAGIPANTSTIQLTLTATRPDGGATSISIPANVSS